jgi:hypothetical protein
VRRAPGLPCSLTVCEGRECGISSGHVAACGRGRVSVMVLFGKTDAALIPELAARRERALDERPRRDRRVGGLRGEFADQSIGVGGHGVRRLQHQPLQRPAIG